MVLASHHQCTLANMLAEAEHKGVLGVGVEEGMVAVVSDTTSLPPQAKTTSLLFGVGQ